MKTKLLVLAGMIAVVGLVEAAEAKCEIWNLPTNGLVQIAVPANLGEGQLEMTIDGEKADFQEVIGCNLCIFRPTAAQRARSSRQSLWAVFRRDGKSAESALKRVAKAEVANTAFQVTLDEKKQSGLPTGFRWASGMCPKSNRWEDRLHSPDRSGRMLSNCRVGEVWDGGVGPIFRQVRTVGWFSDKGGKRVEGNAKATYDWVFFNENPEWVMVKMTAASECDVLWDQVHQGLLIFPYGTFSKSAMPNDKGDGAAFKDMPAKDKTEERFSHEWTAMVEGHDFAAVYSRGAKFYADGKHDMAYLHATCDSSYATHWSGHEKLSRSAIFRFGNAADVGAALAEKPPVEAPEGSRFEVSLADIDKVRADEEITTVAAGSLAMRVGTFADRAEIRWVKQDGKPIAIGPQRLFSVTIEEVESGRRTELDSLEGWTTVATWQKNGSTYWRFSGPKKMPQLPGLSLTVKAAPIASESGIDWSFGGFTASDTHVIAQAAVGELAFLSQGRAMRAIWPGCMGEVKLNPCQDKVRHDGWYPSMGCVMQWEAVWNEDTRKCFLVAAFDAKGGAKQVQMFGSSVDSTIKLALRHRLAWDPRAPGARSVMSGTISWRALEGDWYDAAVRYRDWSRENAVFYPKMGPEGRVSTPMWMKRDLGYIVRTGGWASNAVADVKLAHEILGVPVMAHWYVWHRQAFDNDYPNYFPAKPGFEEGVKRIHELGGYAVPYTNGHIWDMHDAGCEDRYFTRLGAYGACRKRDGSIVEERYRSKETNGTPVVFAAMCPASKVWHDKVGDNCVKVVNDSDCDGYYMDQVGAFSTCECFNPEHGHLFGGGSWWQEAYRKLLSDERARAKKPIFLATEGNAEHVLDQIDANVCWNIPGGIDTAPAFEVCYSGATMVYCRSPENPDSNSRQMRMKYANTLADGEFFGWFHVAHCKSKESGGYLRKLVRFRHKNAEWFYKGEMRRVPALEEEVPVWKEVWGIFGGRRPVTMPIVQAASRAMLEYEYDASGKRLWKTGRVRKAVVYFTNFSPDEKAASKVRIDWKDLGVNPGNATFTRVDEEGNRTPMTREEVEGRMVFEPDSCFGIEIEERK